MRNHGPCPECGDGTHRTFAVPPEWGTYDPANPWRSLAPTVDCGDGRMALASVGDFPTREEACAAAVAKVIIHNADDLKPAVEQAERIVAAVRREAAQLAAGSQL